MKTYDRELELGFEVSAAHTKNTRFLSKISDKICNFAIYIIKKFVYN